MAGQDYSSSITANITAQQTAERISRVADWWSANFTGASDKVDDTFTLRWGDTFVDFAVVELVPSKRIIWRVTDCNLQFVEDKKEWKDTQVVFDISSDGSATTVTMTHAGLVPGVECYNACKKGWDFYILESLQNLLRENRGLPDMQGRRESAEKVVAES
jgi:Activator of Hsp90 ATPase homolog 1-like protein